MERGESEMAGARGGEVGGCVWGVGEDEGVWWCVVRWTGGWCGWLPMLTLYSNDCDGHRRAWPHGMGIHSADHTAHHCPAVTCR